MKKSYGITPAGYPFKVKKMTKIINSYKPFDIVTNKNGDVGFIREVSVNNCQPEQEISYAVHWLVGDENKTAWFDSSELKKHCNFFVEVAKCTCHPFGGNEKYVDQLMGKIGKVNKVYTKNTYYIYENHRLPDRGKQ